MLGIFRKIEYSSLTCIPDIKIESYSWEPNSCCKYDKRKNCKTNNILFFKKLKEMLRAVLTQSWQVFCVNLLRMKRT